MTVYYQKFVRKYLRKIGIRIDKYKKHIKGEVQKQWKFKHNIFFLLQHSGVICGFAEQLQWVVSATPNAVCPLAPTAPPALAQLVQVCVTESAESQAESGAFCSTQGI